MMKEGAIKHKLRQVVFRHRKRFIEDGLKRRPCNCTFNGAVKTPRRVGGKEVVRLCLYKVDDRDEWNNTTCDESLGGLQQAQECPYFECKNDPKDLKAMFASLIGLDGTSVDAQWMAKHYPDIMALTWVIGDARKAKEEPDPPKKRHSVLAIFGKAGEPEDLPELPLVEGGEDEDG